MKLAFLTTDNREAHRQYDNPVPFFGTAPEALLQGFAGMSGLEVHVISCTQRPMKSPEKLAENIYFHSLHVPKIGWMRTLYQGCIRATRRKLRELQPDIVHGQGTERDCSISAVLSGFPNVVTIHGNMAALSRQFRAPVGSFSWLAGKLEDWTLPRAGGVFCNSAYTEELVRARNPRTWRVPNALREAFFRVPLPPCSTSHAPVLLNIGVVGPRKRQLELLEVGRHLRAQGFCLKMLFIGHALPNEAYSGEFIQRVAAADTHEFAEFTGFHNLEELIIAMDHAQACIHFPSEEAFGLVVAEALARNLKFFGARTGGIIEIATGVEGADLIDGNDLSALEKDIAGWLRSGSPRPKTAQNAMRSRYHPTLIAKMHLQIYSEVLSDIQ